MAITVIHPVMAIDYGDSRIGLAATDDFGLLPYPVATLQQQSNESTIQNIISEIKRLKIQQLVIGLPLLESGDFGTAAEKVQSFSNQLNTALAETIPIFWQDERWTTRIASRKLYDAGKNSKQQKAIIDQVAALEILEDWLRINDANFQIQGC